MTPRFHIITLIALIFASLTCGCNRRSYTVEIERADSLTEASCPAEALAILEDIPAKNLRGDDRALHALITVKATDKAFLPHTSDSTIGVAMNYFRSHGPKLRRAEAAFYNGRVLSDLQNHAAALDAYDNALNLLPESDTIPSHLRLRSLILSHNAQILERLSLYTEAVPFFQAAADISFSLGEAENAYLDLDAAIFDLIQLDSIDKANTLLQKAQTLQPSLSTECRARLEITRRYLLLRQGRPADAVISIDSLISIERPGFRNFALMVATKSFQELGFRDSADHYAQILSHQDKKSNHTVAYATLIQNALERGDDHQAILRLFNTFDSLTDVQTHKIGHAPTIISTEFLKYRMEQKQSIRLQKRIQIQILIIGCSIFLILIITSLLIYNKSRHTKTLLIKEQKEKSLLERHISLKKSNALLSKENKALSDQNRDLQTHALRKLDSETSREKLIDDILHNYQKIAETVSLPIPVSTAISNSEICLRIKNQSNISKSDKIWEELESLLRTQAPGFMEIILKLHSGSADLLHIIMLIRAGFRSGEIARLLLRTKATISNHRSSICKDVFLGQVTIRELDDVIRSIYAN